MNRLLIFAVAWALAFSNIADAQTILDSIQRLSAAEKADGDFDPAAYLEITHQALHAWDKASEEEKMRFSSKMFLVHFRRAQIMAATGNFKAAADELRAEAVMQKDFEGDLWPLEWKRSHRAYLLQRHVWRSVGTCQNGPWPFTVMLEAHRNHQPHLAVPQ